MRSPITHELKCWPEFFEHVLAGTKLFELRIDDRDFQVGDTLWQREWEPGNRSTSGRLIVPGYSGREVRQEVTYLLRNNLNFLPQGIVAMSLSPLSKERWEIGGACLECGHQGNVHGARLEGDRFLCGSVFGEKGCQCEDAAKF
jgi:hypothetical protein